MKTIQTNSATVDNAAQWVDAGETLSVGKDAKAGMITPERAKALVDRAAATVVAESKADAGK